MKYKLTFKLNRDLILPIKYNHLLQAGLLNYLINKEYQGFVHDQGFYYGKRNYKLVNFSKIFGKFRLEKDRNKIIFQNEIHIYVAAYDKRYIENLAGNIVTGNPLCLGQTELVLDRVERIEEDDTSPCIVKTLSPIVVYSTFEKPDGTKKRYYYNHCESDYSEMIQANLLRKYVSYHGKSPANTDFYIRLLREGEEKIVFYKRESLRGNNGVYELTGSSDLINVALNAGLGCRNSVGFGSIMKIQ